MFTLQKLMFYYNVIPLELQIYMYDIDHVASINSFDC